ncbi:MAG: methyltransferase domain-containing protein [Candidatus Eisenbacteria bacterium]
MSTQFKWWAGASVLLGLGLVAGALGLRASGHVPDYEAGAITISLVEAVLLVLIAGPVAILAARTWSREAPGNGADDDSTSTRAERRPYGSLFLISFAALFIELMLIRYCNSQIRIFSFYKNVPLIASFLGLGLGASLGRGRGRDAMLFLLWLIPFAVLLSAGSLVVGNFLGRHAALGSTEQILGEVIPSATKSARALSQLVMASFCVVALVVITLLFAFLGRILGDSFDRVERLRGYTVNIVGSLAGIVAFVLLSYLETPPAVWFLAGLLPLLWWCTGRARTTWALVLIGLNAAAVFPSYGDTVWSRYQKLVGHAIGLPGEAPQAYLVQISDVFYQIALDRRPEVVGGRQDYPGGAYDLVYRDIPTPQRVLIVGSGTGNDVAAALRAGVGHVDAVDIDPAIVEMGRRFHPEHPYRDPRVRVIVDDARHAFRHLEPASYDAVVFGLLDSHTQLGMSSVRLDNFVFTRESFGEAAHLIRPGGHLIVTAAAHFPWFRDRLEHLVETATGHPATISRQATWYIFVSPVGADPGLASTENTGRLSDAADADRTPPEGGTVSALGARAGRTAVPSDDWPFLYLPGRSVPWA